MSIFCLPQFSTKCMGRTMAVRSRINPNFQLAYGSAYGPNIPTLPKFSVGPWAGLRSVDPDQTLISIRPVGRPTVRTSRPYPNFIWPVGRPTVRRSRPNPNFHSARGPAYGPYIPTLPKFHLARGPAYGP